MRILLRTKYYQEIITQLIEFNFSNKKKQKKRPTCSPISM